MIYYGIIDNFKENQKKGIYGRKKIKKVDYINIINILYENNKKKALLDLAKIVYRPRTFFSLGVLGTLASETNHFFKTKNAKLELKSEEFGNKIIIGNELLLNNYKINTNSDLFYGLLDNFSLDSNKIFETIMESGGGSTLFIIDKENAKKEYRHYSKGGIFSRGLYTSHPKDDEILIPLNRASELIKSFLLEETVRAYEALGAKKIIIEEKRILDTTASAEYKGANAKVNTGKEREVLRKKVFGKGVFDVERALRDKKFIHDYPNIMSVIEARKNGNQLLEEFTEKINLNAGMDINVLNLFSSNISFNYQREWYFRVEFFDKVEIL